MNRAMSRASRSARDRRSVPATFGIGDRGRQLQERVGIDRLGSLHRGRLGVGGRLAVRLVAPGRIAVGQAQARSGRRRSRNRWPACGGRRRSPSSGSRAARDSSTGARCGRGRRAPSQLVDHPIIEAEVELALGDLGGQHRLEAGDGLVEQAVAGVDLAGQPVDDPGGGRLLVIGGLLERGQGVGDSAFLLVDAGQVDPAVGTPELGDLAEDLPRPASARPSGPPWCPLRASRPMP